MPVLGSCNGLIGFGSFFYLDLDEIILVNPSTREYQLLPPPPGEALNEGSIVSGIGYDCFADEYKVVVIPFKVDPAKGVEVNIWGSKSRTWRKISCSLNYNDYISLTHFSCYGKYTHGALHWIVGDYPRIKGFQIDAFDIVTEKFISTNYNEETFGYPIGVQLEVLGGCLCMCCQHDSGVGAMDIWVMKKYGVKESWSKLASLPLYTEPLALSACGRRLLFVEHDILKTWNLRSYDVDKQCIEYFGSTRTTMPSYYPVHYCIESLVRLPEKLSQHA